MRTVQAAVFAIAFAGASGAGCKKSPTSTGDCAGAPICFDVPSGFTAKGDPVKRPDLYSIAYVDESKAKIEFIARDLEGYDTRWKALQNNAKLAKASDVKEDDFAGGKGKIITYTTPEKEPRFFVSAMLRGNKKSIECVGEYRVAAPKKDVIDACKSIREP